MKRFSGGWTENPECFYAVAPGGASAAFADPFGNGWKTNDFGVPF